MQTGADDGPRCNESSDVHIADGASHFSPNGRVSGFCMLSLSVIVSELAQESLNCDWESLRLSGRIHDRFDQDTHSTADMLSFLLFARIGIDHLSIYLFVYAHRPVGCPVHWVPMDVGKVPEVGRVVHTCIASPYHSLTTLAH